jgi:hypothetical protein
MRDHKERQSVEIQANVTKSLSTRHGQNASFDRPKRGTARQPVFNVPSSNRSYKKMSYALDKADE